jgi:hypothetical protein
MNNLEILDEAIEGVNSGDHEYSCNAIYSTFLHGKSSSKDKRIVLREKYNDFLQGKYDGFDRTDSLWGYFLDSGKDIPSSELKELRLELLKEFRGLLNE